MIQFRAFGSTSLKGPEGNELLSVLSRPKLLSLLVLLGAQPREGYVRRETLLGILWGDVDPERARANLRQFIYRLRGSLGADAIETRGEDEVRLNPQAVWCDARSFQDALSRGELEEALLLYRGELLEGFFPPNAPEFERWVDQKRMEFKRAAAEACWSLAEALATAGNQAGAGHWARRAADLCGWDEVLLRGCIQLLDGLGDTGGALETFRVLEEQLRENDLSPSAATVDLVQEIRARQAEPEGRGEVREAGMPPVQVPVSPPEVETEPRWVGGSEDGSEDGSVDGSENGSEATPGEVGRIWSRAGWPLAVPAALLLALPIAGGYYALGGNNREILDEALPAPGAAAANWTVLAVLPFETGGRDVEAREMAAGIQQGLYSQLSRVPGLTLISDRAMASLDQRRGPLSDLAHELGAGSVLMGEITWLGANVRMRVELLAGGGDVSLWEESYEGPVRDILEIQSEVALRVGLSLGTLSSGEDVPDLTSLTPRTMEAYRPYLRSRAMAGGNATMADLMVEEQLLRQAIARDPTFADAWAALGWNYARRTEDYGQSESYADSALVAAQNALTHDPSSAEAQLVMGWVFMREGFLTRAEESLSRALALNQNLATGYFLRGKTRVSLGRFDEAIRDLEGAILRDPGGTAIRAYTGLAYSLLGEMDAAGWWMTREIEALEEGSVNRLHLEARLLSWSTDAEAAYRVGIRMVEAAPEIPRIRLFLADLALQAGHCGPAIEQADRAMAMTSEPEDLRGTFFARTVLGFAHQACGSPMQAQSLLQKSRSKLLMHVERGSQDPLAFLELAAVYEALGDRETALVWIRKAHQEGFRRLRVLERHPIFETLRGDPAFQLVLEEIRGEIKGMRDGLAQVGFGLTGLQEEELALEDGFPPNPDKLQTLTM